MATSFSEGLIAMTRPPSKTADEVTSPPKPSTRHNSVPLLIPYDAAHGTDTVMTWAFPGAEITIGVDQEAPTGRGVSQSSFPVRPSRARSFDLRSVDSPRST